MLDLRWLREEPDALDRALARRGLPPVAASLREQDAAIRGLQTELQERQARRNALSREIGRVRGQGGNADALLEEVATLKSRIQADEESLRARAADLDAELAGIPNILADDVPDGADESANVELRRWGEPPRFDFAPREHDELGALLGMDFARAAKLSGARFVTLFGPTHIAWTETYHPLAIHLQKKVECGPCQLRVCPLDHRCMRLLTPAEVFAAAAELLARNPRPVITHPKRKAC